MTREELYQIEHCFIVVNIHYGCWGRGSTIEEAKENLPNRYKNELTAYLVLGDKEAVVNNMGSLCYKRDSRVIEIGGIR